MSGLEWPNVSCCLIPQGRALKCSPNLCAPVYVGCPDVLKAEDSIAKPVGHGNNPCSIAVESCEGGLIHIAIRWWTFNTKPRASFEISVLNLPLEKCSASLLPATDISALWLQ